MSIESEITRINNNIAATYTALSAKGATIPETENSANLASTVATVPSGGDPVNKAFDVVDGVLNKPTAAFSDNTFAGVTSVENNGLEYAFYGCKNLTGSVSFPNLTTVGGKGLYYAFDGCTGLTGSVSFPELTTVSSDGLNLAFTSCTGLTTISFPKLNTVGNNGLNNAFSNCTNLTEIHFPAAIQSTIEGLTGYSSKFGATNATIYFDL